MTWNIPLFKMFYDKGDIESVDATLRSGMNWAVGSEVTKFEDDIKEYIGTNYCITFNSGTSALHTALLAYGIGEGDEVIVPSFTFIATANAPLFVQSKPVFADIEERTLGLDPESVIEKITSKTKAIIPIHFGGCPCRIRELKEIADDHNLLLIEDAAEAFGASIHGKRAGTFGDSTMLSFCQNKIITTGEGGALVTDDRDVYEKSKLIRSHGRLETTDYFSSCDSMDYITLGYNFRLSNIAASLGIAQLNKVKSIIQMRKQIAENYIATLKRELPNIIPISAPYGYDHVYQLFSVIAPNRDDIMIYLARKGIMSKIYFPPVHLTRFYKEELGYQDSLPITERVAKNILSLPIYPNMPDKYVETIVETMSHYYEG